MQRIFVIAPAWVGDLVMTQSLLAALKQQYRISTIDVMAPSWCKDLLLRMPEVDRIIEQPFAHGESAFAARYKLGRTMLGNYDIAYVIPNSWKSAIIPYAANIKSRVGYVGEMRYGLLNDARKINKKNKRAVDNFVALAYDKNIASIAIINPKLQVNDIAAIAHKYDLYVGSNTKVLALCPGTAGAVGKIWPKEKYAELACEYLVRGYQVWLLGSPKDFDSINYIYERAEGSVDLSADVPLIDKVDLLSMASIVVANDSGLLHMAAAVGCSVVGLYGVTDPNYAPPLTDKKQIISRYRTGITEAEFNQQNIIADISVAEVMAAINKLEMGHVA
jgi:heptosyltransferase-2